MKSNAILAWVLVAFAVATDGRAAGGARLIDGLVCIEAIAQAGAASYVAERYSFSDWLRNSSLSFYIAGISIVEVQDSGGLKYKYNLEISSPTYAEQILSLAQDFHPELEVMWTPAERPLALDGVATRWARWFPSRASTGYSLPDPLGKLARFLLQGVDGVLYVETKKGYNIDLFATPAHANSPAFYQIVKEKLSGLPGTLTIRSDISECQTHQALIERTTPALLHAMRARPDDQIVVALEVFRGENGLDGSLARIAQFSWVTFFEEGSPDYEELEQKYGPHLFASVPAKSIFEFIHYFSIKRFLLVPDDFEEDQN